MAQLGKLIIENNKLKRQLSQYQQILGKSPFIDDSVLKGGYRVVKNIEERDNIDCCHRKLGMKVLVIGNDLSFKEYILKTNNCKENIWEEVDVTVTIKEDEVFLIEDYSELSENLTTQKELNLILKQLILNLQTQIDNIELTDEKVQISEATNFAQIGQSQKDFNKNVSDYKTNSDFKNQEQDARLIDIENENIIQYDLITDLQTSLNNKLDKGTYTETAQDLKDDIDSKANISHTHDISSITNLQTILDDKQDKLSSFDESILIEDHGNIEGNVSLFEEYFKQQECELNFTPIQIVGVYVNGIKLLKSEYEIILPKKIKIKEYVDENIQIEYTHLKS